MPHLFEIDFTNPEEVTAYVKRITAREHPLRHENYDMNVLHAEEMSIHVKGANPGELLSRYRPNEQAAAHTYRLEVYEPVTKADTKKVINVLSRIQNSKMFSIKFTDPASKIKEGESLEIYTTKKYPFFDNVMDWIFRAVLKEDLADPNAVIAFKPINTPENDTELLEPYGFIYGSWQVLDFRMDEYYTILTKEKSDIKEGTQTVSKGTVIDIYTKNQIIRVFQIGEIGKNDFAWEVILDHNIMTVPVIPLKGEYIENTLPFAYESYISGILPYWNKVVREDSDKDAAFVGSIYPERVEMEIECTNGECKAGKITIENRDGNTKIKICPDCGGSGFTLARSPLTETVVRRKSNLEGEEPIFPGIEYIQKDTDSVRLLKEEIEDNRLKGFASINMEFLANVPLNQSGKAKEVDRAELNSFISLISDNLFGNILFNSYRIINLYRYKVLLGDKVDENLPEISEPKNFDVLTAGVITQEIAAATQAGLSPMIIGQLEKELIGKRFAGTQGLKIFDAMSKLDPLPGKNTDDKSMMLAQRATSLVDFTISENINQFVLRAIEQFKGKEEGFLDMERKRQIGLMQQYANEIIGKTQGSQRPEPPSGQDS